MPKKKRISHMQKNKRLREQYKKRTEMKDQINKEMEQMIIKKECKEENFTREINSLRSFKFKETDLTIVKEEDNSNYEICVFNGIHSDTQIESIAECSIVNLNTDRLIKSENIEASDDLDDKMIPEMPISYEFDNNDNDSPSDGPNDKPHKIESIAECSIGNLNTDRLIKSEDIEASDDLDDKMITEMPIYYELDNNDNKMITEMPIYCELEETLTCKNCSFTCCSEDFENHISMHNFEKPYNCELCSFICKRRDYLKSRMQFHYKEKRFKRILCQFQTRYMGSLRGYKDTHLGDRYFHCQICSYQTNFKKHYDRHMLSHIGEKSFFCDFCTFKTQEKGKLQAHVLIHGKKYKCPLCSYKASSRRLLSSHMLTCCVLIRTKKKTKRLS